MLAVNGFAADGNMFVKKVKQRLEVLLPSPTVGLLFIPMFHFASGTDMLTQKTCPCAPLRA